jgi:hypothetical protein
MLIAPLLALTACAGFRAADIAPLPEPVGVPCAPPVALPVRSLTRAEVERFWGADRDALRDCGARHGLTVAHLQAQRMTRRPGLAR